MNERMRHLERQRLQLVIQSHEQRKQLIAFSVTAGDTLRRLRLLLLTARSAAFVRGLWNQFRN